MSSTITALLALPEDLLEKSIYHYLGKGGISVFHGTSKELFLENQDKALKKLPYLN